MNTEFIKYCVYRIEKQYKTKVIITKQIQEDINDIYDLCSGCSFMSWLNRRLYPEIIKNCLMNHLEYPEYSSCTDLYFYNNAEDEEEEEEEDDGEDEPFLVPKCSQIDCDKSAHLKDKNSDCYECDGSNCNSSCLHKHYWNSCDECFQKSCGDGEEMD